MTSPNKLQPKEYIIPNNYSGNRFSNKRYFALNHFCVTNLFKLNLLKNCHRHTETSRTVIDR